MERTLFLDKCPVAEPTFTELQCLYYDQNENPKLCGHCKRPEYYRCLADLRGLIPLSYSTVQDFMTCHQLYYLNSIRGIRVKNAAASSPLKMGKLWDVVLGKHLGGVDKDGQPTDIAKVIEEYEIENKEIAKVKALFRAYKQLEIEVEPGGLIQPKIDITLTFDKVWGNDCPVEMAVTGFYDRKYPDHFVENKLSGRPDNYEDIFFIQSQIGTYFLADPSLEYVVMEIVRTPDLKQMRKKGQEESDVAYMERTYDDILTRPSHYFQGYVNDKHTYGRKFFRKEFDLDEIRNRYLYIFKEMYAARMCDGWYKNDRACKNVLPGIQCDKLNICRYNNWSETVYEIRQKVGF